jgi:hypothetical protein
MLLKMATGSGLAILAIFDDFALKKMTNVSEMIIHYQLMLNCFSKWQLEAAWQFLLFLMILLQKKRQRF